MDAPRIQYAKTTDGVNIAYWSIGQGKPLVLIAPLPFTHIQLEWEIPEIRTWYERLAQRRTVIRYDGRGQGMSDREIDAFSLDALVRDLEAVVAVTAVREFALMGALNSGPVAIEYGVRYPEMVSHLLLWCTFSRAADYFDWPEVLALRALVDKDWRTFSETVAHAREGWTQDDAVAAFAKLIRESVTPDVQGRFMDMMRDVDVTPALSEVRAPTLVMHRKGFTQMDQAWAQKMAAGIPNARLVLLEGEGAGPYLGNTDAVVREIFNFLGEPAPGGAIAAPELDTSVFRAIVWTDLEDHTPMMQRLGDVKGRDVLREHERVTREALRNHGGEEMKSMGDGFMASFPSVQKALECSLALQKTFASEEIAGEQLRCRIGINAGEPIAEDGDLFGQTVITAARIAAHAEGGEVLVADVVRQLVAGKGFTFEDRGEQRLKGLTEPVRLWSVV